MELDAEGNQRHKAHRKRQSGRSADKKLAKKPKIDSGPAGRSSTDDAAAAKKRNPKAFAFHSINKVARQVRRTADVDEKKHHIPLVGRTASDEEPPIVVAIVGPPKVGKTTLLRGLISNFTKQRISKPTGPITVIANKRRRITFIECRNDINSMIDVCKVCDLAILMIDASFGFEMETFEFLSICQVHGFPKVLGVLNHMDAMRDNKQAKKMKKKIKTRFWSEIVAGAKLFYLTGMATPETYHKREIHNLGRFISVIKFSPKVWKINHPYLLVDRMEDVGAVDEKASDDNSANRRIALYGWVRGSYLQDKAAVHIAGVGDRYVSGVESLDDPCPYPHEAKKRSLDYKERLIYSPFSGVGGVLYDKDAVYIDLAGSHSHKQFGENEELMAKLRTAKSFGDFSDTHVPLTSQNNGPILTERRRVLDEEEGGECSESGGESDDDDTENDDSQSDVDVMSDDMREGIFDQDETLFEGFKSRLSLGKRLNRQLYKASGRSGGEAVGNKEEGAEPEELGGLFKLSSKQLTELGSIDNDEVDGALQHLSAVVSNNKMDEERRVLANRFVTGEWAEDENASDLLAADDALGK